MAFGVRQREKIMDLTGWGIDAAGTLEQLGGAWHTRIPDSPGHRPRQHAVSGSTQPAAGDARREMMAQAD